MTALRVALANIRFPSTPDESVALATKAVLQSGSEHADIICFPECYVPGYRAKGKQIPPPDPAFLNRVWSQIAESAGKANVSVVLGTERLIDGDLLATALVVNRDGSVSGFQDKVEIDPSEEVTYAHGSGRRMFEVAHTKFGVVRGMCVLEPWQPAWHSRSLRLQKPQQDRDFSLSACVVLKTQQGPISLLRGLPP